MPRLKIDDVMVEVPEGATVLDAAAAAGISIPTLCYEKSVGALTSCMICVVKDAGTGRMAPACSARAVEGMEIDAGGEEVRAARREILDMLLSEHVGDCEAPCRTICPAVLNIPRMLRYVVAGDLDAAAKLAIRELVFPATLGRLCSAPCEKGCRRSVYDAPVSIRGSHGGVAERFLLDSAAPEPSGPSTGKTVAVVGAGLAGLSAAAILLQKGHACRVFERNSVACAGLRGLPEGQLPATVLDAEIQLIHRMGMELVPGCTIGTDRSLASLSGEYDAVVVACDLPSEDAPHGVRAQEDPMPVRAVAQGKAAAREVDALLRGAASGNARKPFNSRIGRLRPDETEAYAVERLRTPECGTQSPLAAEAVRCLGCDCRRPVSCKLRRYAEEYGVDVRVKRHMERPTVQPILEAGEVLFEPGKCIKCGICVELTRLSGRRVGLALAGRGLASRVEVPFGDSLKEALGDVAIQCVRACPTGALALRSEEETG